MASYFGASEMQSDGLQTLYLMNPGYPGYSGETQTPSTNMIYLNSAGNQLNQGNLPHPNRQNQQLVGIPVQAQRATSQDPNRPSLSYNLWTPINPSMAVATAQNTHQIASTAAGDGRVIADMASQLGLRRLSDGLQPVVPSQRGLSLSLSPQKKPAYGGYRSETDIAPAEISPGGGDDMRVSGSSSSVSAVSNGISSLQSVLTGSKYLKAAQQLLDEVVNVGNGFKSDDASKGTKGQMKANRDSPLMEASGGGEVNGKTAAELTTAERQEIQMKKAKLINMLDEVEQRYRQYHQQMQIVISAFEATAGIGSAKTYTDLALKTISKQFRCLRDAIVRQIRAVSTRLGEEDCFGGGKMEGSSRLRLVDQHLRQQRALQQLSMMQQHNAWRPQRGLPERSVSVLRAWLFEHFLHPYPKDSDKVMLAKQTGLTRSQVSNWFINARVRLWKPMIEEMYLEETKEQEENGSNDKASKSEISGELASTTQENSTVRTEQINNVKAKSTNINDPLSNLPSTASTSTGNPQTQACFSLMGSSYARASFRDNEGTLQGNRKKTRTVELQNLNSIASMEADLRSDNMNSDKEFYMKFSGERSNRDDYYSITGTAGQDSGFGAYQIGEMGRFDPEQFAPRFSGSGVSLTLGLPHCENLSLSRAQQTYLPNQNIPLGTRLEMGNESNDFGSMNTPSVAHSADAYESVNIQNRKQFATQLFPDFVA